MKYINHLADVFIQSDLQMEYMVSAGFIKVNLGFFKDPLSSKGKQVSAGMQEVWQQDAASHSLGKPWLHI